MKMKKCPGETQTAEEDLEDQVQVHKNKDLEDQVKVEDLIDPMIPGVINREAEVEISGEVPTVVDRRRLMTLGSTTEEDQMN